MSKKAILSTLLISSALLGTAAAANAATSAVKPESKLVSVEKSNAKIYKNSKLQESKKVKKGTVYKVDGYRDINGKKYYRVYQEDTKGKTVYKGYILDKDTKVLKGQKPAKADRFVGLTKDDQTAWKNLYFNKKIKTYNGTKHSSNFEVKYSYNIGGKKYFSLYRGEKWMGYMDGSAFKVLTPEHLAEDKQAYEVEKDYETYNDLYFTEKGKLTVGEKVKVKNIYTFGTGRKYGSIYNEEGKWLGYANMHALKAVETSTPEEPSKPEDEALKKAKEEANKAIEEAQKILDKAQASKESKEAAQKVINAAKETVKGDNLDAIKQIPSEIKKAMEGLKEGVTSSDIEDLENAIKDAEEVVKNDSALTGVDKVKEALDAAKKVLDAAKKGDATPEQIKDAVKNIQDTIKAIKVNKEDLEKEIKEVEDLAKQVYLTKNQEDQLNKALESVKKVTDDLSKENIDAVKKAQETLVKAKEGLQKQPGYKEGEALSKALQNAQKLKDAEKYAGILFQDFEPLKEAYKNAEDTMNELKKDPQAFGSTNTATEELTAQQVSDVAQKLNDALNNLKINAENTKAFYEEAKKAIDKLATEDQTDPKAKLDAFAEAAKKGTAKDYKEILDTAKDLVNAIDAAQTKELKEAIDKAERIIKENDAAKTGNELGNQDFYTNDTFEALKKAVEKGKEAIKLTPATTTKATAHDKANAKTDLDEAIKGLQLANWEFEEQDGKIVLTKYKPLDVTKKENLDIPTDGKQSSPKQAYRKDQIVIPGKLKDMPVVLDLERNEKSGMHEIMRDDDLTDGTTTINDQKYYVSAQNVPVTFKEVSGQKVTTGTQLLGTFTVLGTVDVTGLDSSNVTSFSQTFKGNFGTEIKGIEELNTEKGNNFYAMFSGMKNVKKLDLSKWTMNNAEKIGSMFFQTTDLTDLNLSGWKLSKIPLQTTLQTAQSKVFGTKKSLEDKYKENTFCGVIRYPGMNDSKDNNGNKAPVWIEGLTYPTDAHAKQVIQEALYQSVVGKSIRLTDEKSKDQKEEATSNTEVQK